VKNRHTQTTAIKCKGCANIKEDNFPFVKAILKATSFSIRAGMRGKRLKGFFIDQEHCGIGDAEYLKIFYCPVCGKKLRISKKKRRQHD